MLRWFKVHRVAIVVLKSWPLLREGEEEDNEKKGC